MADPLTTTLDILKSLGTIATAVGVFIASRQLRLNYQAIKAQHKRAKAERAIMLLSDFSRSMGARWRAATKLVESLDEHRLHALYDGTPFEVRPEQVGLLVAAVPDRCPVTAGREHHLTAKEVFALRWEIVSYLNSLEFLCHAAIKDVADVEIVRCELSGLWAPRKHQTFCRGYREAADDRKSHPMLFDFIAHYFERPENHQDEIGPDAPKPQLRDRRNG